MTIDHRSLRCYHHQEAQPVTRMTSCKFNYSAVQYDLIERENKAFSSLSSMCSIVLISSSPLPDDLSHSIKPVQLWYSS